MNPLGARYGPPPDELPLTFSIDGDPYTLPDLPARVWLDALTQERPWSWLRLIPLRLVDGGPGLLGRLHDVDDTFDITDLEIVAEQVLTAALGMDFHAASRLALSVWSNWIHFDGWCVARSGVDPLQLPAPRLFTAAFAWRSSLCVEKSDFAKLEGELWQPPPPLCAPWRDRDHVPGWDDELESSAFLAVLGRGRGGPVAAPPSTG